MDWLEWYHAFLATCAEQHLEPARFIVAFSGGLDSTVLLHVLKKVSDKPILAVHVDHQLQAASSFWTEHCQQFCETLSIDFTCELINVPKKKGYSLEAIAREKRYEVLANYVTDPGTLLLTAHHQTDQAETLLLQLCRGAGVKGLSAMPLIKRFSQGFLARPLLNVEHAKLLDYAKEKELHWIEDPSNASLNFDRNFMRHKIMPLLQSRYPNVVENIARSAQHCAQADVFNTELAKIDLLALMKTSDFSTRIYLSDYFKQLSKPRQSNLIRYWLSTLNWPMPSTEQLNQIIDTICFAKPDANPRLSLFPDRYQLRRYQNMLYAFHTPPWQGDPTWVTDWNLKTPLLLPEHLGTITAKPIETPASNTLSLPPNTTITLTFYQPGERFWPANRQGSHPVKKLCQEWQLPPWQRKQLIFIYFEEKLIGIWHCLSHRYYACDDRVFTGQKLTVHWDLCHQRD